MISSPQAAVAPVAAADLEEPRLLAVARMVGRQIGTGWRWVRPNGYPGACRCPEGHVDAEEALICFRRPA